MIDNQRLLDTFLKYVRIDSESTHEAIFASHVATDLKAIGCQVEFDDSCSATGSDCGNLYAVYLAIWTVSLLFFPLTWTLLLPVSA